MSFKEVENYLQNGHYECECKFMCIRYVVYSQPPKDAGEMLCFMFYLHSSQVLRDCLVKFLLFEKENLAAEKISKI